MLSTDVWLLTEWILHQSQTYLVESVNMVTNSLTPDLRFKQMTLQVLIDRWSPHPTCVSVPVFPSPLSASLTCLPLCTCWSLRLVYRQFYPLAIEICRYLKIPDYQGVSRVLKHWASCKVTCLTFPPVSAWFTCTAQFDVFVGVSRCNRRTYQTRL